MSKPKIRIALVDKIGDTFDYDTERGQLCPMAMHVAFPYIDILRHGGKPVWERHNCLIIKRSRPLGSGPRTARF